MSKTSLVYPTPERRSQIYQELSQSQVDLKQSIDKEIQLIYEMLRANLLNPNNYEKGLKQLERKPIADFFTLLEELCKTPFTKVEGICKLLTEENEAHFTHLAPFSRLTLFFQRWIVHSYQYCKQLIQHFDRLHYDEYLEP